MFKVICQLIGLFVLGMIADEAIKLMFWPIIYVMFAVIAVWFIAGFIKENRKWN